MKDNYLIHGTNALKGALRYTSSVHEFEYEPKSVSVYLSAACQTLTLLANDEPTLNLIASGMQGQANRIYDQFTDLVEEFVKPDQALLVAAGMDEKMAAYFFRDVQSIREAALTNREITSRILKDRLEELGYSVCHSRSIATPNAKNQLRRAIRVIGGGAIITTNFAADMIVGGLVSALSQAYGGYIAGKGFDG